MTHINFPARFLPYFALAIYFLTCSLSQTRAGIVQFTNRTDFENALVNSTLFDFDDLPALSENNFGNSVDFGEATFSVSVNGVFSTNGFGAPTIQIASLNGERLRVELNPGFTALGMDIGDIAAGGRIYELNLSGPSGILLSVDRVVTENDNLGTVDTTFFGFISDTDEIRSLDVSSATGFTAFTAIDNLIYGNQIPEPSSFLLATFSLLGLLGFGRRRRR